MLLLPVAAYLAGKRLVGSYGGSRGLASYLGAIYGDAADGTAPALVLLLAPLLIAVIWGLRATLLKRFARTSVPASHSEQNH